MPGPNKRPYVPVMGLPEPPARPAGMRGLADPPGQPPTRVQQGFEGGLDAILGLLGVGPETKANQIGQLIAAGLPIAGGIKSLRYPKHTLQGSRRIPGVQPTHQRIPVPGADPLEVPLNPQTYSPIDLYLEGESTLQPYEQLLMETLDAAPLRNAMDPARRAADEAAMLSRYERTAHQRKLSARRRDKAGPRLVSKGGKILQEVQAARTAGASEDEVIQLFEQLRPKPRPAPSPSTDLTPTSRTPNRGYSGSISRAKVTQPQVAAIRDRIWKDPDLAALPQAEQIRRIKEEFQLQHLSNDTLKDLLSGNSFFRIGKHKRWTKE